VVAEAERRNVPIFLTGLGNVRAYKSVVLTSRVDGQIVKINFDEGQEVHRGDVLVEIDPQPFAAVLAQAEAAKTRDEALLANARLDFNRAQDLAGKGSGTRQQLDTTRAQVAQLEASGKIDQAAILAAQVQLNYCQIRSPIDGRTGTRQIDEGNIIRANSSSGIVTINQIHPISVDFDLPAEALAQVRAHMASGDTPAVALDRDDRPLAEGKLAVVDNQVNIATGTVRYKATFENIDEKLWPGQFVSIRLQVDVQHDALTVPATAVLRGPEGTYVFIVNAAHVVEKRPVRSGFTNKDVAVVEDGTKPGEQVVIDGQYRIQSGTPVDIQSQAIQSTN
jgi:multidrug efflux system membrane fusion protein